ncbi:hypothetical protein [Microvirga guangxiensis]|uniref:Uncharacterized protein n=1 Tax=Microvirga guangxiensis TaxID=549386 RepID=A0A1G5JZ80_9HYPH|nr:hypothetical protein [Microvirga guangxiensis]SCY93742.1 hypothetical protein SAMN02927923_02942 [Microvirga guangxiensis]
MVQDIIAFFINLLVIDPLYGEMNKRLAEVRAPQAIIAEVRTCAENALPRLAERAYAEPLWVIATALDVWTGRAVPEDVLNTSPQCQSAMKAARVYLESRGA